MSAAHFEFWHLGGDGSRVGAPIRVRTVTGLILQCHLNCSVNDIKHLAAIARQTPDYPVDITLWGGPEGETILLWAARIYYRSENYDIEKGV